MTITSEQFIAGAAVFFIVMWVLDDVAEYMVVRHGWMWLRHGGVLGELQKQDREDYLATLTL